MEKEYIKVNKNAYNIFAPQHANRHDKIGKYDLTDDDWTELLKEKLLKKNISNKVLEIGKLDYIKGLSILGGEPLHPKNIDGTIKMAKAFHKEFPDKTIWIWSGFLFENVCNKDIFKYIDVLVDGQYQDELHDPTLKWCGSKNQRVIDVQKTLKDGKIELWEENNAS